MTRGTARRPGPWRQDRGTPVGSGYQLSFRFSTLIPAPRPAGRSHGRGRWRLGHATEGTGGWIPDEVLGPGVRVDEPLDGRDHPEGAAASPAGLARPMISSVEQPSSKLAAIVAARSGARTGTPYFIPE